MFQLRDRLIATARQGMRRRKIRHAADGDARATLEFFESHTIWATSLS
jgi:hypothetical protein